jgi:hypothetical protein
MKNVLALLILLLGNTPAVAQLMFQKTYGGTAPDQNECLYRSTGCLIEIPDDGYAICHSTCSFGSSQVNQQSVYFLRLNMNGDTIGTRTYNGGTNSIGRSIFPLGNNGFIIGAHYGGGNGGPVLLRTDAAGDTLWTRLFSAGSQSIGTGYFGFPFSDGGFGTCGDFTQMIQMHMYAMGGIAKVDQNGSLIFGKTYYLPNHSGSQIRLYSACETSDGGILATGSVYDAQPDVFLLKVDSTGNIVWAKSYHNTTGEESGLSVKELPDHTIAVTGYAALSVTDWDGFLMRTDASGNIIFAKRYGDGLYQWSNSFVTNAAGDFLFTGNHQVTSTPTATQAYMLCVDSLGVIKWGKHYGGSGEDLGNSITTTYDGGYALAGFTKSFGMGDFDIYFVKTDANGNAGCNTFPLSLNEIPVPFVVTSLTLQYGNAINAVPAPCTISHGAFISTVCLTTDVNEHAANSFELFPVPAEEYIDVSAGTAGKITATIYATSGQQIFSTSYIAADEKTFYRVPLADLAEGLYFMQLETKNGVTAKRFIVKR